MTQFTKPFISNLRLEINKALEEIAARHNIDIEAGNASFSENSINFKLQVLAKNESGEKITREAEDFTRYAALLDLLPTDLNRELTLQGKVFTLVGYKSSARKNQMIIKDKKTGNLCVTSVEVVKAAFNRAV